jgi:hypothetical protein
MHFITTVTDDDSFADYLDYSAGILTSSEASKKKKANKFRPSNSKKWGHQVVNYHHGIFPRKAELSHGFVENRLDPFSHVVEHDVNKFVETEECDVQIAQLRLRGRSKTRTSSGHRHSWREPSVDLFTVNEESENVQNEPCPAAIEPTAEDHNDGTILVPDMLNRARL